MKLLLVIIVLLPTLPACDASFCVEQSVGISHGLYGRVTYQTDVSPASNPPEPVSGELISVADAPGGNVVASGSSDSDGVFQIELDAGSYAACYAAVAAFSCEVFEITSNRLVRLDLHKGMGTYWSDEDRSSCAD